MTRARALLAAAAALAIAAANGPAGAAVALRDDAGREVLLAQPARRIVTLAPFLTELAFSAGAGARVVGASAHSDHPPEAAALPQVASSAGPSLEAIGALRPDLVLAWQDAIRPHDVARLEAMGAKVFVTRARTLDDAPRLLEAIATLAGLPRPAAASAYRERVRELRAAHAGLPRVPVLLEIWHAPLTTLAGTHWILEALEACGGRSAFGDLPGVAPQVPWELVMLRDPFAIVGAGSAADEARFRAAWSGRATLGAVKEGRLVFVPPDLLQRPTMRLAEGVERLCAGLDRVRGGG
ncbi:MAG TPA: cobalamin-binding protein [Usitatibacter sp.]|nr:cobalamin-binding protein [Usitatibacter sp.]